MLALASGLDHVLGLDLILASSSGTFSDLPATWPTLGAGGLVSLIVILLITGRGLATRREVDEANRRLAEANQRADRWEQVAIEALRQNGKLMIGAEVAAEVIKALPIGHPAEEHAKAIDAGLRGPAEPPRELP